MKKAFLFFIFLVNLGFSLETKTIFEGNVLSLKVDFSQLEIKEEGTYSLVSSEGCDESYIQDRPKLPIKSLFLLIPPNSDISSVKMVSEQVQIEGEYDIPLVTPPIPISEILQPTTSTQQPFFGIFQEDSANIGEIQHFRGYSILPLVLYSAQYNQEKKALYWNKSITLEIKLKMPKILSVPELYRSRDELLIEPLVVNPDMLKKYKPLKKKAPLVTYRYIIITDNSLVQSFQALIAHKVSKGLTGKIVTTQEIYRDYIGRDRQEKIRNFIKDYYKNYGTEYVLLGGDVELVPYRGVYAKVDGYIDSNIPADIYYACLDDDWDADKDDIFGELNDKVDFLPEVYVGRASVDVQSEAENFVNKVITYTNNKNAVYTLNELLIAWRADEQSDCIDIKEEIATYTPTFYTIYKEYESKGGVSLLRITELINNTGLGIINHAGHANYWIVPPFYISDVDKLKNSDKPFIFYTIGCFPGKFEKEDCIGEHFINNNQGGAVAFIGNSRYGWYEYGNTKKYSGEYDIEFFRQYFEEAQTIIGKTLALSKITFVPKSNSDGPYRWIMFCLNLLGDPEMTIWGINPNLIEGKVLRADTKDGICKAEVRIIDGPYLGSATTSLLGTYRIIEKAMPEGTYTLRVSKEGCDPAEKSVYVDGVARVDFELTPNTTYTLGGYVKTIPGKPIEGVTIKLSGDCERILLTPSDGSFSFDLLLPGDYEITPTKENYKFEPPKRTYKPLDSSSPNENFTVVPQIYFLEPKYATIRAVVNIKGNGFGQSEDIIVDFGTHYTISTTTSNEFGEFFDSFIVSSQPFGIKVITIKGINSNIFATTTFNLIPPHKISGYAMAVDIPIEGVLVKLSSDDIEKETITTNSGYYEFLDLFAGTYTITAYKESMTFSPSLRVYPYLSKSFENQSFFKIHTEPPPWQQFKSSHNRGAKSSYLGDSNLEYEWSRVGRFNHSRYPQVGYRGEIYIGSGDLIYCIGTDSKTKWSFITDGPFFWFRSFLGGAIANDGSFCIPVITFEYIGRGRMYKYQKIYSLFPDGRLKWKYGLDKTLTEAPLVPILLWNNKIFYYSIDGELLSFNDDGELLWNKKIGKGSRVSVQLASGSNTIYFVERYYKRYYKGIVYSTCLYGLTQLGEIKWEYENQHLTTNMAVGPDETIYISTDNGYINAIRDGIVIWEYYTGEISDIAVDSDGTVYVAASSYLFTFSRNGVLKASYKGNFSHITIDGEGKRYVAAGNSLYIFLKDGDLLEIFEGERGIISNPIIAADGTVYLVSTQEYNTFLTALRKNPGPYSITGRIVSEPLKRLDERVVEGVALNLIGPITAIATSTRDGLFRFTDIPSGTYTIIPSKEGFFFDPQSREYSFLRKDEYCCDFYIFHFQPYKIKGEIKDSFGNPIQGVTVKLSGNRTLTVRTNGSGTYEFTGIPQGSYTVTPSLSGGLFLPKERSYFSLKTTQENCNFIGYKTTSHIWSMNQYDQYNRGQSPYSGPSLPSPLWKFSTETVDHFIGQPVVDKDGTAYIVGVKFDGTPVLFAVKKDGVLKWSYSMYGPTTEHIWSPAIGTDGTIYIADRFNILRAINPNGTKKWDCHIFDIFTYLSSPVIGKDGTIYCAGREKVHAITQNGNLKWKYDIPGMGLSHKVTVGDDVYCLGKEMLVCLNSQDGRLKWSFPIREGPKNYPQAAPAIGLDGTIYVPGYDLYAIKPDGSLLWTSPITGNIALDYDRVYISNASGVYALSNINGSIIWRYDHKQIYGYIPTIVVDGEGKVYISSHNGTIHCINRNGTSQFIIRTGHLCRPHMAIVDGKNIVARGGSGYLCRFNEKTPPPGPIFVKIDTPNPLILPVNTPYSILGRILDANGKPIKEDIVPYWETTLGVISSFGTIRDGTISASYKTPTTPGYGTITLSSFGASDSIRVICNPGPLYNIDVKPQKAKFLLGEKTEFFAQGFDAYKNKIDDIIFDFKLIGDIGTISKTKGTSTVFFAKKSGTGLLKVINGSSVACVRILVGDMGDISISPKVVKLLSQIAIEGFGFDENEPVLIDIGEGELIATITTDSIGFFFAKINLPFMQCGTKTIVATGINSDIISTETFFTLPQITISPSKGKRGTNISVGGRAFGSQDVVFIDFGKTFSITSITADDAGEFQVTFDADNQMSGKRLITARNLFGGFDTAEFLMEISSFSNWPQVLPDFVHSSPALGNIDDDSELEIIIGCDDGKAYVYKSNGSLASGWPKETGDRILSAPALGDIDGDGKLEIVVGSTDGKVYIWKGDGTSISGWPQQTGNRISSSPALGDMDGDGELEIVVLSGRKLYIYKKDGKVLSSWSQSDYSEGSLAIGNLDNDKELEIVVASGLGISEDIYVYNIDGSIVPGWPQLIRGAFMPILGDIDMDGRLEIIISSYGKLYVLKGDGSPVPGFPKEIEGLDCRESPVLGDLNGDRKLEIVVIVYFFVYLLDNKGNILPNWPKQLGNLVRSLALGDVNEDGKADIIAITSDRVYAWNMDGTLIFMWPKLREEGGWGNSTCLALGDINRNGSLEVVFGTVYRRKIYIIDCGIGSFNPDVIPWPTFYRDNCRTGCYPADTSLAKIVLTKSVDNKNLLFEGTITYTINYKNVGVGTATDVVIIDVLPKKVELETVNSGGLIANYFVDGIWQDSFSSRATKIRWIIPEVLPDQEGTISFTVRVKTQ
ncbi:TPA: hypothetical protein DCX16_02320 [bacterium]|nr:hypothetical protein [bacterium]